MSAIKNEGAATPSIIGSSDNEQKGGRETRKSLAEGHGITFPNAEEAIRWLKSEIFLETIANTFKEELEQPLSAQHFISIQRALSEPTNENIETARRMLSDRLIKEEV